MSERDPLIVFTPSGKRGHVAAGTTILDAARTLGVDIDSVCGGRGICTRCAVTPAEGQFAKHGLIARAEALGPMTAVEEKQAARGALPDGRRLGCQARVTGDMVIDVPPESQVHRQVVRKAAADRAIAIDPVTRALTVSVDQPDMHAPSGDGERLRGALATQWGLEDVAIPAALLPTLQGVLRRGDWTVTAIVRRPRTGPPELVGLHPGSGAPTLYGLAIDLGSTTIAAHLCDLASGEVIASSGVMNPQIRFGEDLMSRVSYAMLNPGGADEMTSAVHGALDELAHAIAEDAGIDPMAIVEATLVCNPVMHHLALGIDPTELGQAPFALAVSDALELPASALGLQRLHPRAAVYVLPCIAGHVGADAAAVALAEEPHRSDDIVLIVDVGTNAEILLGDRSRVLACSSPTGPAFEGAQISAGQRAAPGAIERVEIDSTARTARFKVIGCDLWSDTPGFDDAVAATGVTGICGSGIIEAVAELRMAGIIDASGLMGSTDQTGWPQVVPDGRTQAFVLHDGGGDAPRIAVTQGDIRAIQLAKSALHAGAQLLMDAFGTDHVDRVVLAGAFGAHISPKHAAVLGMIPDCALDRVTSAGNAAGTGARIALCNRAARQAVEQLVRQITKIETAVEPRFQAHFVAANALPHAADPYARLRAAVPLPEPAFGATGQRQGRRSRRRAG